MTGKDAAVKIVERKVRSNGFQKPLHPTQVFTYFMYMSDILTFYLVDVVSLKHQPALVSLLGCFYFILALGSFYYGYKST